MSNDAPDPNDDVDLYFEAGRRRVRRAGMAFIIFTVAGILTLAVYTFRVPLERLVRGEIDLEGNPTYSYSPTEGSVEGLEKIHAELLPDWLVAEANIQQWGPEAADERYRALTDALGGDPNLTSIAAEVRTILRDGQMVEKADRLVFLMRAWSTYLSEKNEPYLVQGNVLLGRDPFFYIRSYAVPADLQISVGDAEYRARVVRRLDNTNVVESYLGATSRGDDGAIIVLNRLYDFALDDVWPIIAKDPALPDSPWNDAVLAEAQKQLPEPDVAALRKAYAEQLRIRAVFDAIESRRECGNRLRIHPPGHRGLATDTLTRLEGWATDDPLELCPAITADEVDELRDASEALRDHEELSKAVGALIAWLSQSVAIHEARHVGDDVELDGLQTPLECAVCDGLSVPTRAELSAYLASFAWGDTPAATLFQACAATRSRGGPHARAMAVLLDGLDVTCDAAPPADFQERARALETAWFGRSQRIALPQAFPRIIDLKGVRR